MELVDTHCHIHEAGAINSSLDSDADDSSVNKKWAKGGFRDPQVLVDEAVAEDVVQLVCVGCTLKDSQQAVNLAAASPYCFASIGIHPHEAKLHTGNTIQARFRALVTAQKVVAIGECGLDYFYTHSKKADQRAILEFQLQLASEYTLPLIFHVREAFDDFWPVFDQFPGLKGVIHSFTANQTVLEQSLSRGLYIGLNGIMTFTKDNSQLAVAKNIPLKHLLLETDAPFLTPKPYRGTICRPKHVRTTAEFLANLRNEDLTELARVTTANARHLFNF